MRNNGAMCASEEPFEQQPDPSPSPSPRTSPQPSPTPIVHDSIPESTGENLGDHSSNDTSLSGNEDDMTLQNVYDLCLSLSTIPRIASQRNIGCTKSQSNFDHMETENAQSEGRTREMWMKTRSLMKFFRLSTGKNVLVTNKEGVSTDFEKVSTDRPIVSTDGSKVSTDEQVESTEEHNEDTEEIFEGTEEIFEGTEEQREGTEEQRKGTEEKVESTAGQIKAQRKFLAQQRSKTIKKQPPTKESISKSDDDLLKSMWVTQHLIEDKKFEDIASNEKDTSRNQRISQGRDKEKRIQETRKHGTEGKRGARENKIPNKYTSQDDPSDIEKENDELRLCLTIAPDEDKEVDYEILDKKYPIIDWKTENLGTKPQFDKSKKSEEINMNVVLIKFLGRFDIYVSIQMNKKSFDSHHELKKKVTFEKEILIANAKGLKLESEEESTMALELIRFIKKMVQKPVINNVQKGTGQKEVRPVWNNALRTNHQNFSNSRRNFAPMAVLTKSSIVPISTARQRSSKSATPLSAARPIKNAAPKLFGDPQVALKDTGIFDSGCSRHMTGNKSFLTDYQNYDRRFVAFAGSSKGGRIIGKGKIITGKLDFEDVYFVKELKFNLFSVSQMCDKKNNVLFTETECLILSPDFKLPDENQVMLKIPRKDNMYSFDLKNVVPSKGLPSKIFENDHSCVACQKGKQHKASCKSKLVTSVSQPLQILHMDLFGPTFVKSIMGKAYCLVVTDDYSKFSWVFFLAKKDETSGILKNFITGIENQLNHKVKIIRCDNGTEFKNYEMNQFCGIKGIKREFSNARTPQQNGVAERKNRTLIEAARTMLADSLLPIPFWAEAVNTACYVQNRVLVTKPHNKTPYELLIGRTPIISFMRPFGCPVTILNTLDHLGKFDGKADEGFLVGYSINSKAFRVFNSRTRKTQEGHCVSCESANKSKSWPSIFLEACSNHQDRRYGLWELWDCQLGNLTAGKVYGGGGKGLSMGEIGVTG
ncbi:putative ribonuclease H-like domain-containing protein [Tanacetum coccineum]